MRPSSRATFMPAQTWMPLAKARCRLGLRRDIEAVGVGKIFRVAIGAADADGDEIALLHRNAAQDRVRHHASIAELVGAFEPQHLLDRRLRISAGSSITRCIWSGYCRKRIERVADQIGGGLVAGIEDEDAILQQLGFGEPAAFMLAVDQPRQHVLVGIAGISPAVVGEDFQIAEKIAHRLIADADLLRRSAPARARREWRATSRATARVPRAARRAGCR